MDWAGENMGVKGKDLTGVAGENGTNTNVDIVNQAAHRELTNEEQKLLIVLINPENRKLSARQLAKRAGIHHMTVLRAFGRPAFVQAYMQLRSKRILDAVGEKAEDGEFQHARLALELAGLYSPRDGAINVAIDNRSVDVDPYAGLSASEKASRLRELADWLEQHSDKAT